LRLLLDIHWDVKLAAAIHVFFPNVNNCGYFYIGINSLKFTTVLSFQFTSDASNNKFWIRYVFFLHYTMMVVLTGCYSYYLLYFCIRYWTNLVSSLSPLDLITVYDNKKKIGKRLLLGPVVFAFRLVTVSPLMPQCSFISGLSV